MKVELLTTREVARLLRLSPETIRRLVINGGLQGIRIGRSYRIPKSAVDRMLRQGSGDGTCAGTGVRDHD